MKSTQFPILIVLVLSIVIVVLVILTIARPSLFQPDIFVQDSQELSLPEGARAHLSKGEINEIAYSPDSSRLAVASSIGVLIHDARTGEELKRLKGHRAEVYSVAFSPDGSILASGAGDDTVRLWDAVTGKHKRTLKGHSAYSVAFSPDGSTLASGSADQTSRLWAVLRQLLSYNGGMGADQTIHLWDVATGESKGVLTGHAAQVTSIAFSPDGGTLASGGSDGRVRLWDGITGEPLKNLTGHGQLWFIWDLAFSPDGSTLACATFDGVKFWDVVTGQATTSFAGEAVMSIAYSPNGTTLASGGDDDDPTIRLWDVATGVHKQTLTGHGQWFIWDLAFSPDGSTLASGSRDGTLLLWDLHR